MHIKERYQYETSGGNPTVEFALEGGRFSHVAVKDPGDGPLVVRVKDAGGDDVRDYAFERRRNRRTVAPAGDRTPRDVPDDVLSVLMRAGFAVTAAEGAAGGPSGEGGAVATDGGAAGDGAVGRRPTPTPPERRRSRRRFRNSIRAHRRGPRDADAARDGGDPASTGDAD